MSNPAPCAWHGRPDLAAMGAYADAMGRVVESIAAVLPLHLEGIDLDPVTGAKLARWVEAGGAP